MQQYAQVVAQHVMPHHAPPVQQYAQVVAQHVMPHYHVWVKLLEAGEEEAQQSPLRVLLLDLGGE